MCFKFKAYRVLFCYEFGGFFPHVSLLFQFSNQWIKPGAPIYVQHCGGQDYSAVEVLATGCTSQGYTAMRTVLETLHAKSSILCILK